MLIVEVLFHVDVGPFVVYFLQILERREGLGSGWRPLLFKLGREGESN